jgi:uroporphyrinogen decarboxylase
VQGNLDPVLLFAGWKELKSRAEDILCRAAGRPGHIFNLGHGILPETPVDNVKNLARFVQEYSSPASGFRSSASGSRTP